jgi:hypothetical protein
MSLASFLSLSVVVPGMNWNSRMPGMKRELM